MPNDDHATAIRILERAVELANEGVIVPLLAASLEHGGRNSPAAILARSRYEQFRSASCPDRKPRPDEIAGLFRETITSLRAESPA